MQRRDEFARGGRCILRLMPTLDVGQFELHAGNRLRDGQVAGVTDTATIGVGWSVVVMNLFGDGGRGLEAGKAGHQEHYEECSYELPSRDVSATHRLQS